MIRIENGELFVNGAPAHAVLVTKGAPTNGPTGTYAKAAIPGHLLSDLQNGVFYQNTGTMGSPTWTALTTSTGAGTYSGTFDGTVGGTTPGLVNASLLGISSADALTASTTQTQVGALALTKGINRITTCAHSGDAVALPALTAGEFAIVINDGANPAKVFPNDGSNIDGAGASTAVILTNAKRAIFICVATGVIVSAQLGVASA
jgi:hypothetical protein